MGYLSSHTHRSINLCVSLFLLLFVLPFSVFAAGPKWLKNARKSTVQLYALQQQGDTVQAKAFFIDVEGTLVSPFQPIQKAREVWIVDADGRRAEVVSLLGFNATYNTARLQIQPDKKKIVCLPVATTAPTATDALYLMPDGIQDRIANIEKAESYNYYTLTSKATPAQAGSPVFNEAGEIVGVLQSPLTIGQAPNYVLDIALPLHLDIRPIDINRSELRHCAVPIQMPTEESQAVSLLYLVSSSNHPLRQLYFDRFVQAFPDSPTGYVLKAEQEAAEARFDEALQTYEAALAQKTKQPDEILYSRSKVIYDAVLQQKASMPLTLEQALADVTEAQRLNAQPLYLLHEANVRFALKQYDEAYRRYMEITQTPMRSAEVFMYAWQCQKALQADNEVLLALNDSAVACFSKPYNAAVAPCLLLRSQTLTDMGKVREAINDLNDYEHLMQGRLTAMFYYQRGQLENRSRLYAQALNDMHKAISLEPQEPVFHVELAALLYRLNDVDKAIEACQQAIRLDADFPDAYRIMGICLRDKGNKTEARKNLQKAADLGDAMAQNILESWEN